MKGNQASLTRALSNLLVNMALVQSEYFPGLGYGVRTSVSHLFWTFDMSKCIAVLKLQFAG